VDFHSYVKNLERDSGLLFAVEYEVISLNHASYFLLHLLYFEF